MRLSLSFALACQVCLAVPAHAQAGPPALIPEQVIGAGRDTRGIRIAQPGALLLASFDADGSLSVSIEEVTMGAARAFARADANADGGVSIFEQQDWASAAGASDDALANTITFDSNIDRVITPAEFQAGLMRIAQGYIDPVTQEIAFSSLLTKPDGRSQRPDKSPGDSPRPDRRNKSS